MALVGDPPAGAGAAVDGEGFGGAGAAVVGDTPGGAGAAAVGDPPARAVAEVIGAPLLVDLLFPVVHMRLRRRDLALVLVEVLVPARGREVLVEAPAKVLCRDKYYRFMCYWPAGMASSVML